MATVKSAISPSSYRSVLAEVWARADVRACVAELVGTFGLVFAGCGAIVINALSAGQVTHVGVGLTFGLIVAVMIFATGHLSGAHINPAVTLAFAVFRHFPRRLVLGYWVAQLAGALAATLLLLAMFGNAANLGATLPSGSEIQSFVLEIVLTAILMFVIMAVATDKRGSSPAAVAIGGTVALEAIFAGPISGASMNPARSLAPALVANVMSAQWLYLIGPIVGALIGAGLYEIVRKAQRPA
ncbi:MAG TPA: MIP family channel protein [Anaerolineae bacterium]|nr:MIP family channel protein [Anaerolineae bacterium]